MIKKKEYNNGEITVVWQPELCIHSTVCFKGLPSVFQPRVRPWIKIDAASTEAIVDQVRACPSGALSYYRNDVEEDTETPQETKVVIRENGPLLVFGTLKVTQKEGIDEIKTKITAFCRCGGSNNKPYCDGTHVKNNFKG